MVAKSRANKIIAHYQIIARALICLIGGLLAVGSTIAVKTFVEDLLEVSEFLEYVGLFAGFIGRIASNVLISAQTYSKLASASIQGWKSKSPLNRAPWLTLGIASLGFVVLLVSGGKLWCLRFSRGV